MNAIFSKDEKNLYTDITCVGEGECFATYVPKNFAFKYFDANPDETIPIYKVYSDAQQMYRLNKSFYSSYYGDIYDVNFLQTPTWIIKGKVQYYKDKKVYIGRDNSLTQFDFLSTTLYPDISKFPSKRELYSPNGLETSFILKNRR